MVLEKNDYEAGKFIVRRGVSARKIIPRTKDKAIHPVPVVSEFVPYMAIEQEKQKRHGVISPYYFCYLAGKLPGKRYTHTTLNSIWKAACKKTGENISLYAGTKHSRASQLFNEDKLSKADLKEAGDWARMESVDKYTKVEVATRKNLLEGKKVVVLEERRKESK